MEQSVFDRLDWRRDRVLLDEFVFRLEHYRSDDWDGGEHFRFYKIRELMDQYQTFFSRHPEFNAAHILELGIYDGGSTALWNELLQPEKIVAVDLLDRKDSSYFYQYLKSRKMQERVKTFWNTDQSDSRRMRALVEDELAGRIDLVFDDASHQYSPTKASFEALFPYLRPGAIYIIEDWAWDHWPEFTPPTHWKTEDRLTRFVFELTEAAGTSLEWIASVEIFQGFVAITRGPKKADLSQSFRLDQCISRHEALG